MTRNLVQVQNATVRFAGDSGDGMQLVDSQFADLSSLVGDLPHSRAIHPAGVRRMAYILIVDLAG